MATDLAFLGSNQTLIPFVFVLAIVFGVLELTKIFRNRAVNFLIAIAIAFFTISNATFVEILWSQFGIITAFFIIMFFITFTLKVFGLRGPKVPGQEKRTDEGLVVSGAILFLFLALGFMYSNLIPTLPYVGAGSNLIILVVLILILVIFWAAFRSGREQIQVRKEEKQ
jgi:hypothetical protein